MELERVVNLVGTFSFLWVFGLASVVWKRRKLTAEVVLGSLIAVLMFSYAMQPWRFGAPLAGLANKGAQFGGLALLCVGTSLLAVSLQDGGPKLTGSGFLGVCGGLFLLTGTPAFLVAAGAAAVFSALGHRPK